MLLLSHYSSRKGHYSTQHCLVWIYKKQKNNWILILEIYLILFFKIDPTLECYLHSKLIICLLHFQILVCSVNSCNVPWDNSSNSKNWSFKKVQNKIANIIAFLSRLQILFIGHFFKESNNKIIIKLSSSWCVINE